MIVLLWTFLYDSGPLFRRSAILRCIGTVAGFVRRAGSARPTHLGVTVQCADSFAPSPPYSGERAGVRGGSSSCAARENGPSPQPSPPSTGEREPEGLRRCVALILWTILAAI